MKILKQSTASTLLLGPFVDETDGKTAETALTISQADVLLWKEGGTTLAQKSETTSATHRSNGLYTCPIDTTDTNTLGILTVSVHEAGALPVRHDYFVLPANAYDALKAGTGVGVRADVQGWLGTAPAAVTVAGVPEVDVTHWIGTAAATPTVAGVPEIDVTHFGGTAGTFASGIPSASLTSSAINSVADQVWDEATSGHVASGSYGAKLPTIRDGTAQAGAATTITLDAGASAVTDFYKNQKIALIGGTGAGQGRIISAYDGTTKIATVATWATNPDVTSVFAITPFGSIPGATAPTAAENADAVWDEARADHVASGSFGQLALGEALRINTAQAGGASTITLDASASATDNYYRYNGIEIIAGTGAGQSRQISAYTGSSKVATVSLAWITNPDGTSIFQIIPLGVDAATVAQIADGVWDEARSGHTTAGTFGEYTNADVLRISTDATAADNAEAYFDGTGYAGTNNVMPSVTTVTGNVNGNVAGSVGSVTGAVGSVAGAVGSVTGNVGGNVVGTVASVVGDVGGNLTGSVGSLAAQAKTDVNAEVLDVLNVDTFAQPAQGAPAATTTLRNMLGFIYKAWRNRVDQTSTEYRLFNDDAATVDHKATASDNGTTASRGEVASGP